MRPYLNSLKVPQLFVASGATTWGRDYAQYPYTIGFQPSYQAEGWVYGKYLARTAPGATIAVLFENDDYGKDLLGGLKRGLQRSKAKVIAAQPYDASVTRRLLADREAEVVRRRHARDLRHADVRDPGVRSCAHKLGWKPKRVINNAVASAATAMLQASDGGQNKLVNGTISIAFLKDPTDPQWKNDAAMKLYRKILEPVRARREPGRPAARLRDGGRLDGGRGAEEGRQEPDARVAPEGARHVHRHAATRSCCPGSRSRRRAAITSRSSRCCCSAGRTAPGSRSAGSGATARRRNERGRPQALAPAVVHARLCWRLPARGDRPATTGHPMAHLVSEILTRPSPTSWPRLGRCAAGGSSRTRPRSSSR